MTKIIFITTVVFLLFSSTSFAQPTIAVRLYVLDEQSPSTINPISIPGATATFTDEKGRTYGGKTDGSGLYFTYSLPEAKYKVSVNADRYIPYSDKEFRDLGFSEQIFMRKIGETNPPRPPEEHWNDGETAESSPPDTWAIEPDLSSEILSPDEEQAVIDAIIARMPATFEQEPQQKALKRLYFFAPTVFSPTARRKLIDRLLRQRITERTIRAGIDEAEKKKLGKPVGAGFKELDPKQDSPAVYTLWYGDLKWIVEQSTDPAMTPEVRAELKPWFENYVKTPVEYQKEDKADKIAAAKPGAEVGWQNKIADRYLMADLWNDKRITMGWPVLYPCAIKRCNFRYIDFPSLFIDGKLERVPGLKLEDYFDTAAESDLPSWTEPGEIFGLGWRALQIKTPVWNYAYFPEMYRKAPFCQSRPPGGRFGYTGECPAAQAQNVPKDAPPEFTCERKEGKGNCQQLPGAPFLWLAKSCAPGYSYFTWQVPPKKGTFRLPVCAKKQELTSFPGLTDIRPFPPERL